METLSTLSGYLETTTRISSCNEALSSLRIPTVISILEISFCRKDFTLDGKLLEDCCIVGLKNGKEFKIYTPYEEVKRLMTGIC